MNKHNFTEEDKKKAIEFLNCIADKAKWDVSTNELISIFKLLAFMQQELIPKINANILEIVKVVEAEEPKKEPKKRAPRKK
jgi:hypothetical protein